jgi:uncharacterized glyoxalase superfamily protein PhnB
MAAKTKAKAAAKRRVRRKADSKQAKKAAPRAGKRVTRRKPVARRQPESLRLRSAGPGFTVNDIHKSIAFYCDVLGFTIKDRWEQGGKLLGVELRAGQVTFWLGQDDWQKGRERTKGVGFRIYCSTPQDIDALAARIKARGATLAQEPKDEPWGGRDLAVVDPDGFAITIASRL